MKFLKTFALRTVAGETLLIPTGKTAQEFNGMLTMTETARVMWENYEKVNSFEEMVNLILDEFEVDEETARKDVYGFTKSLIQQGILAPTKDDQSW